MRLILCLAVLAGLALPAAAPAQTERDNGGRPTVGLDYPVSFRSENGGRFQPKALTIIEAGRTLSAALPSQALRVESDNHLDVSSMPLIGQFFRERTAPMDIESFGLPVGQVFRKGDTLIVDARGHRTDLSRLPVSLSTRLPRVGAVSFTLGQPRYAAGQAPPRATPVGRAYLLDNRLWLVSDGKRPPLSGRL